MKKNDDASCLVNNQNIMKELREVLPKLQIIFNSDDIHAKNTLKANIKELAKLIIQDRKEKETDEFFQVFSYEEGKHMQRKIKIMTKENEILVEEVGILSKENKKLKNEKENLEEEKEKLENNMRCNSKNKLFIYYYGN